MVIQLWLNKWSKNPKKKIWSGPWQFFQSRNTSFLGAWKFCLGSFRAKTTFKSFGSNRKSLIIEYKLINYVGQGGSGGVATCNATKRSLNACTVTATSASIRGHAETPKRCPKMREIEDVHKLIQTIRVTSSFAASQFLLYIHNGDLLGANFATTIII